MTEDTMPPTDVADQEADEQDAREYAEVERFFWTHLESPLFDQECPF